MDLYSRLFCFTQARLCDKLIIFGKSHVKPFTMNFKTLIATTMIIASCSQTNNAECSEQNNDSISPNTLCGGYSTAQQPSGRALELFQELIQDTENKNLVPTSMAVQVVAGLNYKFQCKDSITDKDYEVTIFQPLPNRGEPAITNIIELNYNDSFTSDTVQ